MSFGAFNKKSSTTQLSTTSTQGQAFSEVAGTAAGIEGSNNQVTMLDGGAVKQALDFASNAAEKSFGIAGEVASKSSALASEVAAKSVSDTGDKMLQLGKWIVGGLVAFGAVMMFRKRA